MAVDGTTAFWTTPEVICVEFLVVTIMYIFVMSKLTNQMSNFKESEISEELRNIKC